MKGQNVCEFLNYGCHFFPMVVTFYLRSISSSSWETKTTWSDRKSQPLIVGFIFLMDNAFSFYLLPQSDFRALIHTFGASSQQVPVFALGPQYC